MKLFWLFLAFCLAISLTQYVNFWVKDYPVLDNDYKSVYHSKEDVLKRMRYHGILVSHVDSKGQWYFIRKGKTIKLFKED